MRTFFDDDVFPESENTAPAILIDVTSTGTIIDKIFETNYSFLLK